MVPVHDGLLATRFGEFRERIFEVGAEFVIALSMGDLTDVHEVPFRVHSSCISGHVFGSTECDCASQMDSALSMIAARRCGLVLWMNQDGKGHGYVAKAQSSHYKRQGLTQEEAFVRMGLSPDARRYDLAVDILKAFRIRSVLLMSANGRKREALEQAGIVVQRMPGW